MGCLRLLAAACAASLALGAGTAGAGLVRSTAVSAEPAQDPAYQRLAEAANAVVGVRVKSLPNARSNETLGVERVGSGVLIRADGLVLTIGYLILEADQIEVTDSAGTTVPASVVSYDHATGFGLIHALGKLAPKPIRLGLSQPLAQTEHVMIVTGGGDQSASIATVVSRRRYAGYWEYLIDGAIFTAPPRLDHSGAALVNKDGELVGVGSLFVMDALTPNERYPGNMFVPIDLLKPVLDEMIRTGAGHASLRPWLGIDSLEEDGRVKVLQVPEGSPAQEAGIEAGDLILSVNGEAVETLEAFYDKLWNRGASPGADFRLTLLHGAAVRHVTVRSMDRAQFVRRKPGV